MTEKAKVPTWEELLMLLNDAKKHPNDTAWGIYRYMHANLKQMSSQEARTVLASYMKIPLPRPSLLHSCMLTVANSMAGLYDDFRYPQFLNLWGYPSCLRQEDLQRQTGNDGRTYLSLKEKTERTLQSYQLHHAEDRPSEEMSMIRHAVAVRVFTVERDGKRDSLVKLICADGRELIAEAQLFPCNPLEIYGQVFDASIIYSQKGNPVVTEIVTSKSSVTDLFPTITGYIEHIDNTHGHYHIYDGMSRHFVAEKPQLALKENDFVSFSPIIPEKDKFKSAIIDKVIPFTEGIHTFHARRAKITYTDKEKGYAAWELLPQDGTTEVSPIIEIGTNGPSFTKGFLSKNTLRMTDNTLPCVDDEVNIIVFLKRSKDNVKRPYVAYYEKVIQT